ncbi:hypothetical protein [Polaribacter dokdonensis]|uniref:Uncharacterized protein n=1 Tax=Polaribacter dokdonensis DSW-5 TaxID=1300348 RepID=A0A0M9CJ58_9FLAO|nr:hypothetical protein [Polaribacter dokdonensis]KOY53055.1 hypothetical protein I602_2615 [Polaribacter dokdonensis DSW-5]SEE56568.1 hypothetical protein SAMN05444353_2390 [Polaribacter dokdonensis DSW-5]
MSFIKIEEITYKGWKHAVEISNTDIRLIVVPEVGRILHFSFQNSENIFYENSELEGLLFKTGTYYNQKIEAPNIGGNRILPCSEDYFHEITGFRHIPDPYINASTYSINYLENGVVLKSPISNYLGIEIVRKITINNSGSQVYIDQKITKIKPAKNNQLEKIPLTLWSLSKIKTPNISYIKKVGKSVFKNGFTISEWPDAKNYASENVTINDNLIILKSSDGFPQKIGADAKNWVAGYVGNNLLIERFEFDESAKYPDFGTSVTIFGNDLFSELEVLSPEKLLKVGESINYNIKWNLIKMSSKEEAEQYLTQLP